MYETILYSENQNIPARLYQTLEKNDASTKAENKFFLFALAIMVINWDIVFNISFTRLYLLSLQLEG